MMAFDDLFAKIKNRGKFEILQAFFLPFPFLFVGSHFLLENLTAFVPKHRCWVHELDNTSASLSVSEDLNLTSLLKVFIPLDSDGRPESCRRFSAPQWQALLPNVTTQNFSQLEMEPCADGWVYDQSIITSSIVTEWDLVCDYQAVKSLSQSIFLAGHLLGYGMWGYFSDRFGRKSLLPLTHLMLTIFNTGIAFAPSYPIYCSLRFCLGFSISGLLLSTGSLVLEWTSGQYRPMAVVIMTLYFSLGHLLLGLMAHGIQEWHQLQLVMSVPFFVFFLTSWWWPESARWLIVHNRFDDALKILRRVAKINGVKEDAVTLEVLKSAMEKKPNEAEAHYNMLDLVRFPVLRKRILCFVFASFTSGMLFYGLSLNLHTLGHNIQKVQVLFGVSGFLSRFGYLFIITYLGRRISTITCFLLPGLLIIANILLTQEILRIIWALLAIGLIMNAPGCISISSTEVMPTVVRDMSKGTILLFDRTGAILAPLVNILTHYIPVLPQIIFATAAIAASLLVFLFLPESRNQPMPDTIQEVECRLTREERPKDQGNAEENVTQF
ncbi:steroid transmembrane transporter SLC22A24 isoform X1 [Monodelphis domestica]|uniref:steroid transmembrane transporter SLC22A24 isoform X1 n=1 Tax=Monodelphis domestica TaxID=13616 RepID=UPI0024E1EEA7|nr:steroid transmembrane transporter SLC22A24 isoform X1 [Monodelphis domestica]